jgi:IS1 family transposase
MKWIESFKYALNTRDMKTIDKLIQNIPEFKKIEDMRDAYSIIGEAKKSFEDTQLIIQKRMNQLYSH